MGLGLEVGLGLEPVRAHRDSELREELIERALPPGGIDSGW